MARGSLLRRRSVFSNLISVAWSPLISRRRWSRGPFDSRSCGRRKLPAVAVARPFLSRFSVVRPSQTPGGGGRTTLSLSVLGRAAVANSRRWRSHDPFSLGSRSCGRRKLPAVAVARPFLSRFSVVRPSQTPGGGGRTTLSLSVLGRAAVANSRRWRSHDPFSLGSPSSPSLLHRISKPPRAAQPELRGSLATTEL